MKLIWIILTGICLLSPANAEFYRYTDENGVVRFTDDPAKIPETGIRKYAEPSDLMKKQANENPDKSASGMNTGISGETAGEGGNSEEGSSDMNAENEGRNENEENQNTGEEGRNENEENQNTGE